MLQHFRLHYASLHLVLLLLVGWLIMFWGALVVSAKPAATSRHVAPTVVDSGACTNLAVPCSSHRGRTTAAPPGRTHWRLAARRLMQALPLIVCPQINADVPGHMAQHATAARMKWTEPNRRSQDQGCICRLCCNSLPKMVWITAYASAVLYNHAHDKIALLVTEEPASCESRIHLPASSGSSVSRICPPTLPRSACRRVSF